MRYRKLGKSGILVSVIGFGCWGIGGLTKGATSYGVTNDAESLSALKRAFDLGVTFYDTADIYGNGRSEELLGQAFSVCRDRVVIASKVGMGEYYNNSPNFSSSHIRRSLIKTLDRLRSDYVDIYQLHNPPPKLIEKSEVWETLLHLKQSGLIRLIGVSLKSPVVGFSFFLCDSLDTIQVNFSALDQRALMYGLLDEAREKNIGIIARTPLNFGFLSERYSADSVFDANDHRSRWSQKQRQQWIDNAQLFTVLNEGKKRTLAQLALSFCAAHEEITTVIPGMLSIKEVEENVEAEIQILSKEELAEMHNIYMQRIRKEK